MTAFELAGKLKLDSSEFSSSLGKQESAFKKFGNRLSAKSVAMGHLVGRFAEKVIASTGRFVKGAVQESMSFDKSMAQVAATLGETTDEVKDLSRFARQMGATTAFTAQEAAEGLNYMALAGYDTQKSMKMLPSVLNLAAAGNMELARASDMVTDAESALALKGDEVNVMIDQMAKTSSKTNTSVEQLGDAILTVGGSAKKLKGGTAELNALLGVLANNGIKGAEGGTALRNVLNGLANPAGKAAKGLKQLGVEAYDADGNLRSMPDVLVEMNEALSDKSMKERTEIFAEMFNVRDLKSIEALLGMTKKDWKALSAEITNSKDAAKQMAETQLDNLAGDVTKFNSALGEAKLTIVEKLTPSLRNLTKAATNFVTKFANAWKRGGIKGALKEAWTMTKNVGHELASAFKKNMGLSGDATWTEVAQKIREKLSIKLNNVRLKLADYFDLGDDASWAEIGGSVLKKLGENLKSKGEFLKALFLGDKYKEGESTWTEVASVLSEEVSKAFENGGIIDLILGQAGDLAGAAISFASDFVTGVANWLEVPAHVDSIVTNLTNAFTTAIPKLSDALGKLLSNETLWNGVRQGMTNIVYSLVESIFGKGITDKIRRFFGQDVVGEINKTKFKDSFADMIMNPQNWGENEAQVAAKWNQYITDMFNSSNVDPSKFSLFQDLFSYDSLMKGKNKLGLDVRQAVEEAIDAFNNGGDIESLKLAGAIGYTPDFSAVEDAEAPTLHGTVEYTPAFGDGGDSFVAPNGQKIHYRRKRQAKGNWYVPYDDYPSLLHRGEMVLTKSQARQFRDGGGGFDVNSAINNAVSAAMSKVYVMMNGDKVGDLTTKRVRKNINARSYNKLRAMGG